MRQGLPEKRKITPGELAKSLMYSVTFWCIASHTKGRIGGSASIGSSLFPSLYAS